MSIQSKIKDYHFEIRHLIILFIIIVLFQIILSYIHSTSTSELLNQTMELYKRDSAERLADLTTISLEMLLETNLANPQTAQDNKLEIIQAFNIILSQQAVQQNVDDICVLISSDNEIYTLDSGADFYLIFFENGKPLGLNHRYHESALKWYSQIRKKVAETEQIYSYLENTHTLHVLVPFVPKGEFVGAVYMRITPDIGNMVDIIATAYDHSGAIFSALILLGLLAMFYMTSYMVKERDLAQKQLYEDKEVQIKLQIEHQKEALFTRRIYHTHHKAEKIMGFIKQDLKTLSKPDLKKFGYKIEKYVNYMQRVVYDMKSYDPPIYVIRNPMFQTDINEVIRFITENMFGRVYKKGKLYHIQLELSHDLPIVPINEYVIWEIIEPLIQNCIDHNVDKEVTIKIKTNYNSKQNISKIVVEDDGIGIQDELLQTDKNGIKKIFLEHISTKDQLENSGYGCYLVHEICVNRCGWLIDADNRKSGGARLIISIPHNGWSRNK